MQIMLLCVEARILKSLELYTDTMKRYQSEFFQSLGGRKSPALGTSPPQTKTRLYLV